MPKIICFKCGKVWHGWALKYKSSVCSCGEPLNRKVLNSDMYVKRHVDVTYIRQS